MNSVRSTLRYGCVAVNQFVLTTVNIVRVVVVSIYDTDYYAPQCRADLRGPHFW